MWILEKPLKADVESDLKIIKTKKFVDAKGIDTISALYEEYDKGAGVLNPVADNRIPGSIAEGLYNCYGKTYSTGALRAIRTNILEGRCVYCSLRKADTLDHFYHKDSHKSLSVLRYNLVPACQSCNNKKKEKNGADFLHPYYNQRLKTVEFLRADASVNKGIPDVKCYIDSAHLTAREKTQIEYQWSTLELKNRINIETNAYLGDVLSTLTDSLPNWGVLANTQETRYGKNDWRVAAIQALGNCPAITMDIIKNLLKKKA